VDGVDGVGNGTSAGSTCIGDGGRTTGAGIGAGAGAAEVEASAGAGTGAGAGAGAAGVRANEKFEGPGL
jgi:hypothetical protein